VAFLVAELNERKCRGREWDDSVRVAQVAKVVNQRAEMSDTETRRIKEAKNKKKKENEK
jgi:hypothetical protein